MVEGSGSRRDFVVACPSALAASEEVVSCLGTTQLVWPVYWLDAQDGSATWAALVVQDIWEVCREELDHVPPDLVLAIRAACGRSSVDVFLECLEWWCRGWAAQCQSEGWGPCVFGTSGWEAERLGGTWLVAFTGLVVMMSLMLRLPGVLWTRPLLLCFFLGGG